MPPKTVCHVSAELRRRRATFAGCARRIAAYPVREPLLVVIGAGRLDGLDGEVGGEDPADEVGDGLGEAEHVEEDQDDGPAGGSAVSPVQVDYDAEGAASAIKALNHAWRTEDGDVGSSRRQNTHEAPRARTP